MHAEFDSKKIYSLQELKDTIVPLAKSMGMLWVRVFGSYARGEAEAYSDVDVLVDKGDARALSLFGLAEGIYEATGKEADVYDISELVPGPFRDNVLLEAVPLT